MPKYEIVWNAGDYTPVADRITLFYARYPTGRILTRLVSRTNKEITVQAFVYRSIDEQRPSATGLASERIGDGEVNTVACLENTETSAIGRALANLGLTASSQRPSREEMEKASRERVRRVSESARSGEYRTSPPPRHLTRRNPPQIGLSLQHRADRVFDALELLGQAERAGLTPRRARCFRDALTERTVRAETIDRVERVLRSWTSARHASHLRL